eukprot:TRINITY_DN5215_c0_g1::TRINITY_DN5215_c0_g1_i1::g.23405::m.23405 TRINITY_DN5215_c0_g1::TRINITY_DN5215_c0_g1_i1::g.23405  ORF type:complete len:326 (-),score=24.28,sp/Q9LMX8/6PGL1_ARATH/36.40/2e-35,Glucosamine_iso/PF01182.15/3.4e-50,Sugar-bind/PF04198.8/1,Sugar-bind/PF04198.8/1.6e+02 TRINITY_DN5215_c0_g1_i1:68-991(-)
MLNREIRICQNTDRISHELSQLLVPFIHERLSQSGKFSIALSGGSSLNIVAKALSPHIVQENNLCPFKWLCYFADERCVPHEHTDSNSRAAAQVLLEPLQVENVRRVDTSLSPEEAAACYASVMDHELEEHPVSHAPVLDLVVLGVGEDGHVASLFPGHPLTLQTGFQQSFVLSLHDSPKPPPSRVTLSFRTINSARMVVVLATGAGKRDALSHLFTPIPLPTHSTRTDQTHPTHSRTHHDHDDTHTATYTSESNHSCGECGKQDEGNHAASVVLPYMMLKPVSSPGRVIFYLDESAAGRPATPATC